MIYDTAFREFLMKNAYNFLLIRSLWKRRSLLTNFKEAYSGQEILHLLAAPQKQAKRTAFEEVLSRV